MKNIVKESLPFLLITAFEVMSVILFSFTEGKNMLLHMSYVYLLIFAVDYAGLYFLIYTVYVILYLAVFFFAFISETGSHPKKKNVFKCMGAMFAVRLGIDAINGANLVLVGSDFPGLSYGISYVLEAVFASIMLWKILKHCANTSLEICKINKNAKRSGAAVIVTFGASCVLYGLFDIFLVVPGYFPQEYNILLKAILTLIFYFVLLIFAYNTKENDNEVINLNGEN